MFDLGVMHGMQKVAISRAAVQKAIRVAKTEAKVPALAKKRGTRSAAERAKRLEERQKTWEKGREARQAKTRAAKQKYEESFTKGERAGPQQARMQGKAQRTRGESLDAPGGGIDRAGPVYQSGVRNEAIGQLEQYLGRKASPGEIGAHVDRRGGAFNLTGRQVGVNVPAQAASPMSSMGGPMKGVAPTQVGPAPTGMASRRPPLPGQATQVVPDPNIRVGGSTPSPAAPSMVDAPTRISPSAATQIPSPTRLSPAPTQALAHPPIPSTQLSPVPSPMMSKIRTGPMSTQLSGPKPGMSTVRPSMRM